MASSVALATAVILIGGVPFLVARSQPAAGQLPWARLGTSDVAFGRVRRRRPSARSVRASRRPVGVARRRFDHTALADEDYVEDYLPIERVEPTALWLEGTIGPVPVSAAAAKLAQPDWSINVVLGRKSGKRHVLEVGNVYP